VATAATKSKTLDKASVLPRLHPMTRPLELLLPALLVALAAPLGAALRAGDVDLFFVERNKNRNLVQFTVTLDHACAPLADEPVGSYWRMLEVGPDATEPVGFLERQAYGVDRQERVGGRLRVRLKALPERELVVRTTRTDDGCHAEAWTAIQGQPARLTRVSVMADESSFWRTPLHVDLHGLDAADRPVRERIEAD